MTEASIPYKSVGYAAPLADGARSQPPSASVGWERGVAWRMYNDNRPDAALHGLAAGVEIDRKFTRPGTHPAAIRGIGARFATDDNPSDGGPPCWPREEAKARPTMLLDNACCIETSPAAAVTNLWDCVLQ